MFDLSNKTALITGAGQGVGAGIARQLAACGARIVVNDLYAERADATVAQLTAAGHEAQACVFDVCDYTAVADAVTAIESDFGVIDILINNAGVPPGMGITKFRDTLPADWRAYMDVNIYGVMNASHVVLPGMCDRGWGRIITITSGAGTVGMNFGISSYAAGKGGGISFMRHLAIENARTGVTANTVAIGIIDNQPDPEATAAIARSVPTGRLGTPEDIGSFCVYLASEEASWMTGQTVHLNGGSITT
jgi:NAD(P)-dependent dehydrogenase (short-subunit alcohol dehydrogenase family)